ncbi:MAG: DUF3048 domain-containing protein, partial [Bifidobacteriaceae bacterium]|nr:DUF3048 domain-containing protein [Bifidobacteriaceae bacterium]
MQVNLPRRRPLSSSVAAALAVMVGALSLAACGKEEPKTIIETAAVENNKDMPPEVPTLWPLTGLPGGVVERPSLAVKVENPQAARPQSGLEQADLVWEEMVEGGESRFIAVFNSQVPESVGPVRSVRPMDGPILGPTRGLLAFSGGQERFIEKAKSVGLQVLSEDSGSPGFFRSDQRSAPHNLYLNPAEAWAAADDAHLHLPAGEFVFADSSAAATAVLNGEPTVDLAVTISAVAKPKWSWDEATAAYLRSEGDTPSESADGVRLSAANVIALTVPIENAGGTDAAG